MNYDPEKLQLARSRYHDLLHETTISLAMLDILEQAEAIAAPDMIAALVERGVITKDAPLEQMLEDMGISQDALIELTDELLDYAIAGESL